MSVAQRAPNLKQQQTSIVEARYALKRADESVTQGRSIMLFTIITSIFLPLSFMSSVFGMNVIDFHTKDGEDSMTLRRMISFLFPISVLIILIFFAVAFSALVRKWIYTILTFFLEQVGMEDTKGIVIKNS